MSYSTGLTTTTTNTTTAVVSPLPPQHDPVRDEQDKLLHKMDCVLTQLQQLPKPSEAAVKARRQLQQNRASLANTSLSTRTDVRRAERLVQRQLATALIHIPGSQYGAIKEGLEADLDAKKFWFSTTWLGSAYRMHTEETPSALEMRTKNYADYGHWELAIETLDQIPKSYPVWQHTLEYVMQAVANNDVPDQEQLLELTDRLLKAIPSEPKQESVVDSLLSWMRGSETTDPEEHKEAVRSASKFLERVVQPLLSKEDVDVACVMQLIQRIPRPASQVNAARALMRRLAEQAGSWRAVYPYINMHILPQLKSHQAKLAETMVDGLAREGEWGTVAELLKQYVPDAEQQWKVLKSLIPILLAQKQHDWLKSLVYDVCGAIYKQEFISNGFEADQTAAQKEVDWRFQHVINVLSARQELGLAAECLEGIGQAKVRQKAIDTIVIAGGQGPVEVFLQKMLNCGENLFSEQALSALDAKELRQVDLLLSCIDANLTNEVYQGTQPVRCGASEKQKQDLKSCALRPSQAVALFERLRSPRHTETSVVDRGVTRLEGLVEYYTDASVDKVLTKGNAIAKRLHLEAVKDNFDSEDDSMFPL